LNSHGCGWKDPGGDAVGGAGWARPRGSGCVAASPMLGLQVVVAAVVHAGRGGVGRRRGAERGGARGEGGANDGWGAGRVAAAALG
jgi:hypothetical protein